MNGWSQKRELDCQRRLSWMTYRQAVEFRAHARKGEKGSPVVYANTITRHESDTDSGVEVARDIHFLKGYIVFNVEQIDGLPAQYTAPALPRLDMSARIARAEAFSARPVPRLPTAATVPFTGPRPTASCCRSSRPFATPRATTPPWRTRQRTGVTCGTGCGGATAHESRLARDFGTKRFGSEGYTIEELVVELGAAFLCADLDLTLEPREDHAAYIVNWMDILKADNRAIFAAASHAQRAGGLYQRPAAGNRDPIGRTAPR
jgi:antirestriction protein ArdC